MSHEELPVPLPPGAKEQPKCIAIVICNEVIEDKRTNSKTLVSLFNRISTHELPCVHPRMFAMASFTSGLGKWPLALRIMSPSNTEILRINGELEFNDPLAVLDLVIEVRLLPLKEEGVYAVDIIAGTSPIAERRFFVQLVKEVGAQG